MDSSAMQHYMSDAKLMFKQYTREGGTSSFVTYKAHLKMFYLHTLNSHCFGIGPELYNGATVDESGFMLHKGHSAAEAALMQAANIDYTEVGRIFYSVDAVHAYS